MKITISEKPSCLDIEVSQAGNRRSQLIAAFEHCQQGSCNCPANLPHAVNSFEIETIEDGVKLQLNAKEGEVIDRSHIEACLRFTLKQRH
ncbi:MAG: hypothetical protein L3J28_07985 [Candidatus Polarisedimenticolaceae bacterium]|nr:hypothetical protein [Candidatus Polarisedimenticolaceae bacterium]